MKRATWKVTTRILGVFVGAGLLFNATAARPQEKKAGEEPANRGASSYSPVVTTEEFSAIRDRMAKAKPEIMKRQMDLLALRYDLGNHPAKDITMSGRDKPIQQGVRAKLPKGVENWEQLAALSPDDIREKSLFPAGYLPLPHPNHAEGGMVFPKFHIDLVKKQDGRDVSRFDLDFDLPEHFLPAFPPAIWFRLRNSAISS